VIKHELKESFYGCGPTNGHEFFTDSMKCAPLKVRNLNLTLSFDSIGLRFSFRNSNDLIRFENAAEGIGDFFNQHGSRS